jgi:hypothetical protein
VANDELDQDCWLLLHDVRLRGFVDGGAEVVEVRVVEAGLVARAPKGLRITPAGRELHTTWARLETGSEVEVAVDRMYRRFLDLNRELIRVCNDWQVRPGGSPNDHKDPTYDWSVIDRLVTIDERVGPILRTTTQHVPRFAGYRPRLRQARERVNEGEHEWLTSPRIDSYHTVWMQLHEDLLLALGVDRASEE